jgi:hypothetical protein
MSSLPSGERTRCLQALLLISLSLVVLLLSVQRAQTHFFPFFSLWQSLRE